MLLICAHTFINCIIVNTCVKAWSCKEWAHCLLSMWSGVPFKPLAHMTLIARADIFYFFNIEKWSTLESFCSLFITDHWRFFHSSTYIYIVFFLLDFKDNSNIMYHTLVWLYFILLIVNCLIYSSCDVKIVHNIV